MAEFAIGKPDMATLNIAEAGWLLATVGANGVESRVPRERQWSDLLSGCAVGSRQIAPHGNCLIPASIVRVLPHAQMRLIRNTTTFTVGAGTVRSINSVTSSE